MRIESAFIADHAEVNPATRTLDVQSGFQSSIKVPELPFRHALALALVIQVASDDYGRAFTLGIDVDRVDELPVMLHQDFSFEIPRGIHAGFRCLRGSLSLPNADGRAPDETLYASLPAIWDALFA